MEQICMSIRLQAIYLNHLIIFLVFILTIGCEQSSSVPVSDPQLGRGVPSPQITVFHKDSEEEKAALAEPFIGVTTNGKIQTDLFSIRETGVSTAPIQDAVNRFLTSLEEEQRSKCIVPVDDIEWRRWTNIDIIEYKRTGLGLEEMTTELKDMAFDILRESLSPKGIKKAQNIMKMEGYLGRLANEMENLAPDLYWFMFFGEPSATEPWGWQLDGHHLIINYFVLGDQIVMTPTFMGSEPNYIEDGQNAGTRTFEQEEQLGIQLFQSLSDNQKNEAVLDDHKEYNNSQAIAFRDNAQIPIAGVQASSFTGQQIDFLVSLIQEYVGNIREGHAAIRMDEVKQHINDTYFSWIGARDGSGAFYYRVQSPVILIEFDHQIPVFLEGDAPSRKHIHTIVRTPNGNDYGRDLLRQHLEQHPH